MRLLIIDDEGRTREFLQHRIEWKHSGITEVRSVKNGLMALELIAEWVPDIILCDIRMPKMDGIEFAKQLRLLDVDSKLIFLSGFSDKEYLFSAIQLQAFQFIEKPIKPDILLQAVGEAVAIRQKELDKKKDELRLQAAFDENVSILRREMVRKLITDPSSPHVVPALMDRDTFLLSAEGPFTVTVAPLFWNTAIVSKETRLVQEEILSNLAKSDEMQEWRAIAGIDMQNWLIIVMSGVYGSAYTEGRARLEQLMKVLHRCIGANIQFYLGVGKTAQHLLDIPQSYRTAIDAGNLQFYNGCGGIGFHAELISNEPLETDWEELKQFREAVRRGETRQAEAIIQRLTEQAAACKDLDIIRVKDVYFQFLLILHEVAQQQGLTDKEEDGESRYIWKEIDRIPDLNKLHQYVLSFLAIFEKEEGAAGAGKMREVIRYMHAHYHEKGFGIQAIADHVNLSETYLCSFFKKQCGQTIKQYITSIRLEKAKELLADHELKLYYVAQSVGFHDANYFTTFFKKYAGCTPSEYRERLES